VFINPSFMVNLAENLQTVRAGIPAGVKLIVVSKLHTWQEIRLLYDAGQRRFGENRVQELLNKQPSLPVDIEWHFIGHLQTNKVKFIAPFIHTIQSVDSLRLLTEIDKEAKKQNRIIHCLLEAFIASEETKFGLDLQEAEAILSSEEIKNMQNIRVSGVMGMATFTEDESLVKQEFAKLKAMFDLLKMKYFACDDNFREISMGMSGDYPIAIGEGSTMIRVGSRIFQKE